MKAQLLIGETTLANAGHHAQNLGAVKDRVARSGIWKKQRVIVMIPAAGSIPTRVYLSHLSLQYPPNQGVVRMAAVGMEVGEAYSQTIASILEHQDLSQWEYLLTIEHDNLPPPDGLMRLIAQMEAHPEFSGIGGLYFTKGEGGVPQIWGDPRDPMLNFRPQPPDPNGGLVECCGTGMGFNLWRLKMFKDERLRKPWFRTADGCSQDLYFASDAKKHGYRFAVDCSVLVGHYDLEGKFGPPDFVW